METLRQITTLVLVPTRVRKPGPGGPLVWMAPIGSPKWRFTIDRTAAVSVFQQYPL